MPSSPTVRPQPPVDKKLAELYHRKSVLDDLIRSLENYNRCRVAELGKRAIA
jgi:hypothetical protein